VLQYSVHHHRRHHRKKRKTCQLRSMVAIGSVIRHAPQATHSLVIQYITDSSDQTSTVFAISLASIQSTRNDMVSLLPKIEKSLNSKRACIFALVLGFPISIACFASATLIRHHHRLGAMPLDLSTTSTEILALVVNVILTLLMDGLAYIHATSLRWALYGERRLEFNTNIRLLRSSRQSLPNKWYSNAISLLCLILCYAGTSTLFIATTSTGDFQKCAVRCTNLNAMAIYALGFGLLGQSVIGAWSMIYKPSRILTWSSNPMNTTLAALHDSTNHQPRRCMLSVQQSTLQSGPVFPKRVQSSAASLGRSVRALLILTWVIALLAVIWTFTIVFVTWNQLRVNQGDWSDHWRFSLNWNLVYVYQGDGRGGIRNESRNDVALFMTPSYNNAGPYYPLLTQYILAILFICGIQGVQTIGTHCVELLVNMSRDEDIWRRANTYTAASQRAFNSGAQVTSNPFFSALTSWQNVIYFIMKAVLHWLFGQGVIPLLDIGQYVPSISFDMVYGRLFVYAIAATAFACFATYLAYHKPSGCQPAAWGHIQTLANLVDDWNMDSSGRLWWGDKGCTSDGFRHAGTSNGPLSLGKIRMDSMYA